jgi:hypothetical protein
MKKVEITWKDATSGSGWMSKRDARQWAKTPLPICRTMGYVIRGDREQIVVAQNISDIERQGNLMAIARRMVVSIKKLRFENDDKDE